MNNKGLGWEILAIVAFVIVILGIVAYVALSRMFTSA